MTLLSTIALIVDFQPPGATVDKGLIDGLRPGDEGEVFYLLSNGEQEFRFDAGLARVTGCEDRTCQVRTTPQLRVSPGYRIDFPTSQDRTGFEALVEVARMRISDRQLDSAALYLARLDEMSSGNPEQALRVRELRRQLEAARRPAPEPPRDDPVVRDFREAVARGDALKAEQLLASLRSRDPDPEVLRSAENSMAELWGRTMFLLPAQTAVFGLDRERAVDHNQTPSFRKPMKSYWIDRRPVSRSGQPGGEERGVSFAAAEQHCRSMGKRLPTEFEWELAARDSKFQSVPQLSEWTNSWYLPYPGNAEPEQDYGERFKVVRGYDRRGNFAPARRFYLEPAEIDPRVGFRCARDQP